MNICQFDCLREHDRAKAQVQLMQHKLACARRELRKARKLLNEAIAKNKASWEAGLGKCALTNDNGLGPTHHNGANGQRGSTAERVQLGQRPTGVTNVDPAGKPLPEDARDPGRHSRSAAVGAAEPVKRTADNGV